MYRLDVEYAAEHELTITMINRGLGEPAGTVSSTSSLSNSAMACSEIILLDFSHLDELIETLYKAVVIK